MYNYIVIREKGEPIDAARTSRVALDLRRCTPCIEIPGVTLCTNYSNRPQADAPNHPVPKYPLRCDPDRLLFYDFPTNGL